MECVAFLWFGLLLAGLTVVTCERKSPISRLSSQLPKISSETLCGGGGSSCQGQDDRSRSPKSRFSWRQTWTPCSVTCGVGLRRRQAFCFDSDTNERVGDFQCSKGGKPRTEMGTCTPSSCPPDSFRVPRSAGDDLFHQHFGQLFSDEVPSLPLFVTGEWSACSVTCGQGTRSRAVTCKRVNTYSRQAEILPDWQCFGSKPDSFQPCDPGPCAGAFPLTVNEVEFSVKTFRWHVGDFTACSRSCLGGTQESEVKCVEEGGEEDGGGVEVSPSLCSGQKKPPVPVRSCNAIPCPPRWAIGDYSACSQQCGGGLMRRSVRCVQQEADDTLTEVEQYRCPDPVPVAEMDCNTDYCPAQWTAESWSECSETCGIGTQTRRVACKSEPVTGHLVTVSDNLCSGPRPHNSRSCSVLECPEDITAPPVIQAENYTFIQLRRSKRVKLNVGGRVVLLPGQSVTIRCPVKNFHRPLIFWSRQFKLVPMSGRVRASFHGNLKIRRGIPESDTGTYTCMAGPESADVHIEFMSRKQAFQRLRHVRKGLHNNSSRATMIVNPGKRKKQDGSFRDGSHNNQTSTILYVADDWSPCSVTCGSGHQRRQVTCTQVTKKYVKLLPERECEKQGMEKPEDMKKCNTHLECPHWVAGQWSACSVTRCVRDGYAERRRKFHCAYSNGTSAPRRLCRKERRSETARLCVNVDCISHWTTSKWTPCRPSCGSEGVKLRLLMCSWRKTGLPAWSACRHLSRPNTRKVCKLRPCARSSLAACNDSSRYCSLARMLKMCRFNYFRRMCCRSCSSVLQSTLP